MQISTSPTHHYPAIKVLAPHKLDSPRGFAWKFVPVATRPPFSAPFFAKLKNDVSLLTNELLVYNAIAVFLNDLSDDQWAQVRKDPIWKAPDVCFLGVGYKLKS